MRQEPPAVLKKGVGCQDRRDVEGLAGAAAFFDQAPFEKLRAQQSLQPLFLSLAFPETFL